MTDLFVWHGSFICKHNSFMCVTWRPTSPSIKRALFPIKRALSPIKISLIPTKRSLSPVKRATCSSRWALFAIKQPYILWKEPHFVRKQSYFVLKEHSMSNIFLCPFFPPSLDAIYFSPQFQRAPDFTSPFSNTYMYKSVSYFHEKSVVFYENSPILYQRAPIMFWFSPTDKFVFPSQDATHFFALIRRYSSC